MTTTELLTFSGALFLMVITPGPGVLACISRSLSSGFSRGAFVALGIISGDIIFVLMALYGLAAVAQVMGGFFIIVKYLGAVYLAWLGYRTWTSAGKVSSPNYRGETSHFASYFSGLCLTLGNPKAIVFYLSFLPAFVDLNCLSASDIALTLIIIVTTLATVLLGYAFAATRFRLVIRSRKAQRKLNRCSGGVMITAAVAMVVKE